MKPLWAGGLPGTVVVLLVAAHAHSARVPEAPSATAAITAASPALDQAMSATTTVNLLLVDAKQRAASDPGIPEFARQKIAWLTAQQRARALTISLLSHPQTARLDATALMASGEVDGAQVIVISRPRLLAFIAEEGGETPPSRLQRNDFLLSLVHETVHLERPQPDDALNLEDRLREERRAWRVVDVNVVRPLLAQHEPVNPQYLKADAAIRSCGERDACPALDALLAPSEISRH